MAEITEIKREYEEVLKKLSDPELISDWERFEEISKRKSFLEKIIAKDEEIKEVKNKIDESKSILASGVDGELIILAEEELKSFKERQKVLEKELENLLKGGEEEKTTTEAAIIEIRAGAGGEEAALFAGALFRMYSKYAVSQGWRQKVLDSRPTELGGFKEIIFELRNGNVFSQFQYEGGVHRVQRIPVTEKIGRIHTSTSSVAVLPKPKKAQIKIRPEDLRIDFYRASGPGGQYVNRRETAVRITHLPSGIVVTSQTERSQFQNKENALAILEARILERKEMAEIEKLSEKRKAQIGWAKRAEKIRTYNFPQDRVTDHRIKKSWHDIESIMSGYLSPIIKDLAAQKL